MTHIRRSRLAWAGFASGPLAWGLSTQIGYSWATLSCGSGRWAGIVALALALFALAGAYLSWDALACVNAAPAEAPRKPRAERLIAMLGIGLGLLFALGILFQATAALVFAGCER